MMLSREEEEESDEVDAVFATATSDDEDEDEHSRGRKRCVRSWRRIHSKLQKICDETKRAHDIRIGKREVPIITQQPSVLSCCSNSLKADSRICSFPLSVVFEDLSVNLTRQYYRGIQLGE